MLRSQIDYYDTNLPTLLILVDLRDIDDVERFHHERAGWQGDSDIEMLSPNHAVLLVYAGGARRLGS
jgi:hypothetical protein